MFSEVDFRGLTSPGTRSLDGAEGDIGNMSLLWLLSSFLDPGLSHVRGKTRSEVRVEETRVLLTIVS